MNTRMSHQEPHDEVMVQFNQVYICKIMTIMMTMMMMVIIMITIIIIIDVFNLI